jgi:outer membrane protein assembly factor BamD (BamD/ComL family)
MMQKYFFLCLFLIPALFFQPKVWGQPNTTINLDKEKPAQYQDRLLPAEKTGDKKLGFLSRTYQDMVSHYNYFFNANNKLNFIIEQAQKMHTDDYSKLLPFYDYSLSVTALDKRDLDSIIYKCYAGILLHDLRSDWVDDFYLLLGKAYLLRKNFDSAAMVFQYINYIYAPKDDGYDIPIGSNVSNNQGIFTVSTNENRSLLKKITTKPTTRNDSFIWQIRNYIESNQLDKASGLIALLKPDPLFPKQLQKDLWLQQAYLFYKQNQYDSAATYLSKSISEADNKQQQARWEFLTGQLYQLAHQNKPAIKAFETAITHTIDPYLEVYARLNIVALSYTGSSTKVLQNNLRQMYQLAHRDKYADYRDIIYYAAAALEIKQQHYEAGSQNLQKSIAYSVNNPEQKQKSMLLLASTAYNIRQYPLASLYYDSIQTNQLDSTLKNEVIARKKALKIITGNLTSLHLQDSLLQLAKLNEADRLAAVKKLYRRLRKEQGLAEEKEDIDFGSTNTTANVAASGLFGSSTSSNNANDFYFANATLKLQGYKEFKQKWGNRPNVDNWQRQSAINNSLQLNNNNVTAATTTTETAKTNNANALTLKGMLDNIPLTEKQIGDAHNTIINDLYSNAQTFQNNLEKYADAVDSYEKLMKLYPENQYEEAVLFNLIYCYKQLGLLQKSDSVRKKLMFAFPNGTYAQKIKNIGKPTLQDKATEQYEHIYNLFIEGNFKQALAEKAEADKTYGKTYWTPQLMYIQAVYDVKQKNDSSAIQTLQAMIHQFPQSPMVDMANTMIDVLKRRKEIENYLTNLVIEKNEDNVVANIDLHPATLVNTPVRRRVDSVAAPVIKHLDSTATVQIPVSAPVIQSVNDYAFNPSDSQYIAVVLNKVDPVFASEARNAFYRFNLEKFYNLRLKVNQQKLNDSTSLVLIGPFANAGDAVDYLDKTKPMATARIIPWLKPEKYIFSMISPANLQLLYNKNNIDEYIQFLKRNLPEKF